MIQVEIYKKTKKNGQPHKVHMEFKEFENDRALRAWSYYWSMQCDTRRYGWREVTP